MSLEVILSSPKYELVKANSGKEALKILLREHNFSIILMDVMMPVMSGLETAEFIRQSQKLKNIPIIFLTADNNPSPNIFKGYQLGAVDYILKPIVPEILKAKVGVFADLYLKNYELETMSKNLAQLNEQLHQRTIELERSNKELEKFAYVSSHDLQEPLRTITSYIQLLQKKMSNDLDEETVEYMNFVVNASQRMRNIIISLLEYSRINREVKPFQQVQIHSVLKDVQENMFLSIRDNKVRIETGELPVVTADYTQITMLFQNLIGNAIKFRSEKDPQIQITAKKEGDNYVFSVQDNGIGIDPKHENKIFEMFQRLNHKEKYPGTGIGLAICKKIVERHGGSIWMSSEKDRGSTFYFTLKAKPASNELTHNNSVSY